jgi:hypothetical protein
MKTISLLVLGGFLTVISSALSAQIAIGGYNVYYGHLHNHCAYSDGKGSPALAYTYARDNGKLDFFSLSDHDYALTLEEYAQIRKTSDSINQAGTFTALYGFEWSHSTYGHVTVIGTPDYCNSGTAPYNTFTGLTEWLSSRECVAFFNHPGRQNSTGIEFNHFTSTPSDKFVGMELWNKTDRFNIYYYTDGYFTSDGMLGYFDEALTRNWRIGASGSEDNHAGTWGTMTPSKLAVLAPANTREDIMNALKARRFYSTYDKTLALSFKIGGNEMGSVIPGSSYSLQIQASDVPGDNFTQVQLLKNGIVQKTWSPGTNNVNIKETINCFDGEYYYVKLKQSDSDEVISSPIWIEGGTANLPPVINLTAPATNEAFAAPATLTLTAVASDPDGTIQKVAFFQGNNLLGEDLSTPYEYTWNSVAEGVYKITAVATDNRGSVKTSDPATVIVYNPTGSNIRSVAIISGSDDAEESAAGTMYMNSTDLELVYDSYNSSGNQTVGLRFTDIFVPVGATIANAYIQFTCDEATSSACSLEIRGEATDHSAPLTSASWDLSGRTTTNAAVTWTPDAWASVGESSVKQRTPDISSIVQEIVNRPGFTPSGAITLIITGTGTRTAEAYEGASAAAARLIIEYTINSAVIPEFDPIGPLMQGSVAPDLPAASKNGISGTWDPATISTVNPGTFDFSFTPDPGQNATPAILQVSILPAPLTLSVGIASGNDDVEEYNSGKMLLNSMDIDLVYDSKTTGNQKVGLRFNSVALPAGSLILNAYLQFTVSQKTTAVTNLSIYGQKIENAAPFNTTKKNVANRVKTIANVNWTPAGWLTAGASGADQQSPDLKAIIQEIVDLSGWKSGNSMAFIISGTGNRSAVAYEDSPAGAAKLVIQYSAPALKSGTINSGIHPAPVIISTARDKLTCYPVPFTDELNIRFVPAENEKIENIMIFNASGHQLKVLRTDLNDSSIPMSGYQTGIYLIRVLTNQGNYAKPVIKK